MKRVAGLCLVVSCFLLVFSVTVTHALLRVEATAEAANMVGGWDGNLADSGSPAVDITAATICGGGGGDTLGCEFACAKAINQVADSFGTVCGGTGNVAGTVDGIDNDKYATVGGGRFNTASGQGSTVSGGTQNYATAVNATVGGGYNNIASHPNAAIGGGFGNHAYNLAATVCGGEFNVASGMTGTACGGIYNNAVGTNSFAAGSYSKANHDGVFFWGDNHYSTLASSGVDQFIVRAAGHLFLTTTSNLPADLGLINTSTGAYLTNGGIWTNNSDRSLKENFRPVDTTEVLEKLSAIPVTTWNYKSADQSVRHIGPVAQDFHAAFNVGDDDRHLNSVDTGGVAFAAIQGLYRIIKEQTEKIRTLEDSSRLQMELLEGMRREIAAMKTDSGQTAGPAPRQHPAGSGCISMVNR